MQIAYLSLEKNAELKQITVKTHSLKTSKLFPSLNNEYRIRYDELFRPVTLNRIIRQKNLNDLVETKYDYQKLLARQSRKSDGSIAEYVINKQTRDVFSFLAYLAEGKVFPGSYPIDGNGSNWQVSVKEKPLETVNTAIGKYKARRLEISFNNLTEHKQPYVDMVTNNMLKEGNKLSIWVDDRQLILKAVVKSKGITTHWELTGLSP